MSVRHWTVSDKFEQNSSAVKFTNYIADNNSSIKGSRVAVVGISISDPPLETCEVFLQSDLIVGRIVGSVRQQVLTRFSITKGSRTVKASKWTQFVELTHVNPKSASFVLVSFELTSDCHKELSFLFV